MDIGYKINNLRKFEVYNEHNPFTNLIYKDINLKYSYQYYVKSDKVVNRCDVQEGGHKCSF